MVAVMVSPSLNFGLEGLIPCAILGFTAPTSKKLRWICLSRALGRVDNEMTAPGAAGSVSREG
jgi:hypothetical protein